MRGRVISVLFLLLSLSPAAFSDCNWTPRYSGQFRATVYDVAVDAEGFIWIATGYGVQLLEQTATGLNILDAKPIAGSTRVLALNGTIGYAGSGTRIFVLRRNGKTLEVVRSVEAGATINDLLVATNVYAATSNGIVNFDVFGDGTSLVRSNNVISTSSPNVTSLAVLGQTMYAADGDSSVETISIAIPSLPQTTGSLSSLPRSTAVHITPNNFILVSDDLGRNTDLFAGTSRFKSIGYGTNAYAPLDSTSFFAAGPDRAVHAVDATSGAAVAELFEEQLAPTGGTSNRVYAMARRGEMLYVAAGDMGLVTFNVATLASPHPLVSYDDAAATSAISIGDKAYFTNAGGFITETAINRSGLSLTPGRTWDAGAGAMLRDQAPNTLLTTSGANAKVWAIDTATATSTATFRTTVTSAVLTGTTIVALLADGSVWRAPAGGPVEQVNLGGAKMNYLARSGDAIAIAQVTDEGRTSIRYYPTSDRATPTRTVDLDGAAIGGLALSASSAAVFTFRGLNVIDFVTGNVRVLPESHRLIPRQLMFSGGDLLVLGDTKLAVWNATTGTRTREHSLPATAVTMHASPSLALIATTTGKIAIDYTRTLPAPASILTNRYYERMAAAGDYLYLFADGRVDEYWVGAGTAPRFEIGVSVPGAIDIAALPQSFYTLNANGSITAYSLAGVPLAEVAINEGPDAQPLAIFTAGNAVWVSLEKGCFSGACEQKTLVLDPKSLAVTSSMNGGAIDVFTSGTRAYALFNLPDETRVFNIANPLQPAIIANAASPQSATSIAFGGGKVYVLGTKVSSYNESLTPAGELLNAASANDAHIRIAGDCAVLARGGKPDTYSLPAWVTTLLPIEVPSNIRSIAMLPNRLFLLTEHSIEVWTSGPVATPSKRRSAR